MENRIFRKKSVERVSSPEQLNDYIRVSNPGIWLVLASVIVLLIGVCVWGVFGTLDTKISTVAVAENGRITVYVREADISSVEAGMVVTVAEREFTLSSVATSPLAVTAELGDYALHVGDLKIGEWVYAASAEGELTDGVYKADIVVDSVSPMSFIFN